MQLIVDHWPIIILKCLKTFNVQLDTIHSDFTFILGGWCLFENTQKTDTVLKIVTALYSDLVFQKNAQKNLHNDDFGANSLILNID